MATKPYCMDGAPEAMAQYRELIELSRLQDFDLYSLMRLLSDAGCAPICRDVDREPTETADSIIVHYKFSEALHAFLVALRARQVEQSEVESRSCDGCSGASSSLSSHLEISV